MAAAAAAVVAVEAVVAVGAAVGRLGVQERGWWAEVEQLSLAVIHHCLHRPSRARPAGGQSCCPCG